MTPLIRLLAASAVASLPFVSVVAQEHPVMPPGMTHEQHMALMKQHGQMAVGFDQDKATHHFTLTANGGVIQVTAMDAADQVTRDAIQKHLQEIAVAFGSGDFEKPFMTHGETPPESWGCSVIRMRSRTLTNALNAVGSCESRLQTPMRWTRSIISFSTRFVSMPLVIR